MIKTGHLGRLELFSLAVITASTNVFLSFPQQFVLMGGPAGWYVPLVSMIVCLGVWWVITPVLKQTGRKTLHELVLHHIGRWMVVVLYVLVILYFIVDCASTMRLFTETVITTVLPRSPISFIAIPFAMVIAYFAHVGIEGLTRISWLLLPVITLGLCALLLLNANWYDPEFIKPYLGRGIVETLKGGGIVTGVFLNLIIVLVLSEKLRNPADAVKIGFWSIVTVGLTYAVVTLVFSLVFPPEASMRAPFPMYQLGRLIYVGRFITRMEAAFVFIWVAMAVIKLSFCVWLCTYLLANMCKMPVNRPLVFPMSLIMYALSFITRNYPEMLELNTGYLLRWAWAVVVGVPLLIMLWLRIRDRGPEREEAPDEQQTSNAS